MKDKYRRTGAKMLSKEGKKEGCKETGRGDERKKKTGKEK